LLALIAGQDVEPVEGSDGTDGRWRIAHNVAPDRVALHANNQLTTGKAAYSIIWTLDAPL
jgi:hypothetical protein